MNKLEKEIKELRARLEAIERNFAMPLKEFATANGLMWSKEADYEMCWDDAMKYAKNLREGGYSDWRLPTIKELQNVFDYEKGRALIPFSDSLFWSSTERSDNASYAWNTYLYSGYTYSSTKGVGHATRCVRRDDRLEGKDERNGVRVKGD